MHLIPVGFAHPSSYSQVISIDSGLLTSSSTTHLDRGWKKTSLLLSYVALPYLVNCLVQRVQPEIVEETFRTNILQIIYPAKEAAPHVKRGESIINTTSVRLRRSFTPPVSWQPLHCTRQGYTMLIDYSATKGAIVSSTHSLARQVHPRPYMDVACPDYFCLSLLQLGSMSALSNSFGLL